MQTSDWIALGSLIISLFALWVSWLAYHRDRSSLKLSLDFESRLNHGIQYRVTVTNNGRRPETLMEVQALFWFKKPQVIFEQEVLLKEGENKVLLAPLVMISSVSHPLAVRAFEARDSLGNKYRAYTHKLFWKFLTAKLSKNG